ncbi:hypothetical protein DCF38_10885 [Edwardsiella piscicida]|uniref:hypothetical protein n=1 Tax=Edwardsiella piscicida TaxID=1263550 RepID=UPI0010570965|nr:hypothetical protein [Edwardsiella piscicida]UCQ40041.1 hypothetical protein DCF38_10885 [Edwardsiella piscicida]
MDEFLKMFPTIPYENLSSYRFDKKELISVTEMIDSSNDYFEQLIEKYKSNDDAVLIAFSFNANRFPKLKNQKVVNVIYDDENLKVQIIDQFHHIFKGHRVYSFITCLATSN